MFDYLDFPTFGAAEVLDVYGTSSPGCVLEEQDQDQDQEQEQDLSAFLPELIQADWQQHLRCSQCRWMLWFES